MRIVFFDCVGGASGDMLLSALLDAGATEANLNRVITAMHLDGCSAQVEQVMCGPLSAKQVTVITPREETERHATELIAIVDRADLSASVKNHAIAIIQRLAQVEAHIHNATVDTIHLHEIGGDDTLIDIVGVLSALEELNIEQVYVSPLPLARGLIQSMHGLLPLPAPATLALLKDVPVHYVKNVRAELVTPTGAALLTSLATEFDELPPMQMKAIGVGAGHRKLPFPNVIRAWVGETQSEPGSHAGNRLGVLQPQAADLLHGPSASGHGHGHEHEHEAQSG